MSKQQNIPPPGVLEAVERDPRRGALFWWLYDHHARLTRQRTGQRVNWPHFVAQLPEPARLDAEGKPATPEVARKTWLRVRRLKEQEQAERDKRRRTRSREPERGADADRPPPVVATPAPRPPVPSYPVPSPPRPTAPEDEADQQARSAKASRQIHDLRCRIAVQHGHDAASVVPLPGTDLEEAAQIAAEVQQRYRGR